MASISKLETGERRLQFTFRGIRKTLWLGKVSTQFAEQWQRHVAELVTADIQGRSPKNETSQWIVTLSSKMRKKLTQSGLIEPSTEEVEGEKQKKVVHTIESFISFYLSRRTDMEESTVTTYDNVRRNLVDQFGPSRTLQSITIGEIKDWRRWLSQPKKSGGQGLGENTVSKRASIAKHLFAAAIDYEYITKNPFDKMKGFTVGAKDKPEIPTEIIEKVLKACPDSQWRLIVALSRFAGLRCPSEVLSLCWGHVDTERGRMDVQSPKTKRYKGKERRVVPIAEELEPYLQESLAELLEDFDPKAKQLSKQPLITRYRSTESNLRSQLRKIVKRAGETPWVGSFNTLRSNRETELAARFPSHVVCEWMGNSEAVARKNYLRVTEADFERATGKAKPTQFSTQSELVRARQGRTKMQETA